MRKWVTSLVVLLSLSTIMISGQAIVSYELSIARQDSPGTIVKTIVVPAASFACVTGTGSIPAGTVQWLSPNASFKVEVIPDTTRVCTYTAPWTDISTLSTGVVYVMTAKYVNEAGQKSPSPSASNNPFGVAGTPANILRVGVSR